MESSTYTANQLSLEEVDKEIFDVITAEEQRQASKLEMIASENFTSGAVLEATGSVLTNKYAEGFPGSRYYGGCEIVDKAEILAIDRAKQLFGAAYANVQPHCGSSANMIVLQSFLSPGDAIVGMSLSHGGHLSHGSNVSMTGKIYNAAFYGVDKDTELIDFNEVEAVVAQHKPKILIAGASAYPRTIDFQRFAQIAHEHGSLLLVDMAHIAGLVAAGIHPSPVPYADVVSSTTHKTLRGPRGGMIIMGKDPEAELTPSNTSRKPRKYSQILNAATMPGLQGGPLMHVIAAKAVAFKECMTPEFREYQFQVVKNAKTLAQVFQDNKVRMISGGTDNHLVLVDVRSSFNITGKEAEIWLDDANISVNKNAIPFDTESVFKTSGIRFGLPAITSRGIAEKDIALIAEYIIDILKSGGDIDKINMIGQQVRQLTSQFPMRVSK